MRKTAILLMITLLLTSCDIFLSKPESNGKNYLVAIGMGYTQNRRISNLDNTYNDFRGIVEQFETLSEFAGRDYEITTFSDYASIDGEIVFGYDHKTADLGDGEIFHPYTERMRKPKVLPIDESSRDAIRKSVLDNLIEVFESTSTPTADDTIFFYYTGHGTAKGGPVLHHSNRQEVVYTDFSMKEIEERFLSRYDSKVIVILDSCYSGRSIDNSDLGTTLKFRDEKDIDGNSENKLTGFDFLDAFHCSFNDTVANPRIFYLTACSDKQKSYECDIYQNGWNSEKYGAFTYQILRCWGYDTEAMKSAFPVSKEGSSITLSDMYEYISDNMSRQNRKKSTPCMTRSRYDITLFDFSL